MKVIFQANDGRQFENADECVKYERQQKERFIQRCWNENGKELTENQFDEAAFVVQTGDAPEYDVLPRGEGCWIWFCDEWVKTEKFEEQFAKMKDILNDKDN